MRAVFRRGVDASSKNSHHNSDGRFELDLSVFFGDFLCAKESYPRSSAEKIPGFSGNAERRMHNE